MHAYRYLYHRIEAALSLLAVIAVAFSLLVVAFARFVSDGDGPIPPSQAEEPDGVTASAEEPDPVTAESDDSDNDVGSRATRAITGQPAADRTLPPPLPASYDPPAGEIQAEAKRLGGAVAQALTTYEADMSLADVLDGLAVSPDRYSELSAEADIVHHPGMWSRGTVEYAQMGGHLNDRASIMVVVRQELGVEELERIETRTMDVRVVRTPEGSWALDRLASAGGVPVDPPASLSALAAAVIDDPRIRLPDSAIWDIYAGHTDEALLVLMAELADRTPYDVAVLHTGHPYNVFETDRVSNHSIGHAVDIHRFGETLVVDDRADDSTTRAHVEWLADRTDIKELGSPWKLPDATAHTFTNEVHQDHIHVGVY